MSPGPTFERVYQTLREQLIAGRYPPGQHLEPVLIGEELHASITPVRDALHRLAGEQLVEAPRLEGFRTPLFTEFALRQLYGWSADLLLLALAARRRPAALRAVEHRAAGQEQPAPADAPRLFRSIGQGSGNAELQAALGAVLDRLGPARSVELEVLDAIGDEMALLRERFHDGDRSGLRRSIIAYHSRRQRQTPLILEAMHRLAPGN